MHYFSRSRWSNNDVAHSSYSRLFLAFLPKNPPSTTTTQPQNPKTVTTPPYKFISITRFFFNLRKPHLRINRLVSTILYFLRNINIYIWHIYIQTISGAKLNPIFFIFFHLSLFELTHISQTPHTPPIKKPTSISPTKITTFWTFLRKKEK